MEKLLSESPWTQPDWLSQSRKWIHSQLDQLEIEIIGEITQPHIRPWSTVMQIPTSSGVLYFKASAEAFRVETALTVFLAEKCPTLLPEVLAADTAAGWMLMADGGDRLRNVLAAGGNVALWPETLALYAEMQREIAVCLPALLSLGMEDRRLERLPALYEGLLKSTQDLGIDLPDCLTAKEHEWLCNFSPDFARMCEQLSDFGIPETLQHDDLHDGNILISGERRIVFDWGDACISHPFFSLVVSLRSVENTLGLAENDPILLHVRDRYLETWSAYGSQEQLIAALDLALKIGMVCHALTWQRVLYGLAEPLRAQYIASVGGWMQEFQHSLTATH